jgi:hypothetical protein
LPIEIRQEILTLAIPDARTVTIWSREPDMLFGEERQEFDKTGPDLVPSLLHVNKEMREFAMKWYTLSFARQLRGRAIWFDFNRDTLRLCSKRALRRFWGTAPRRPSEIPYEDRVAIQAEVGGKVRFLDIHDICLVGSIAYDVTYFYNLELLTANYKPKHSIECRFKRMWENRLKREGREVKIPKFRVKGGAVRELGGSVGILFSSDYELRAWLATTI